MSCLHILTLEGTKRRAQNDTGIAHADLGGQPVVQLSSHRIIGSLGATSCGPVNWLKNSQIFTSYSVIFEQKLDSKPGNLLKKHG